MDNPRFGYELSYKGALEAAGATVHAFQEFGSYQGEWLALVTFEGETGWVSGYYGSCSGCDAIQGEFGYDFGEDDRWNADYSAKEPRSDDEIAAERGRFAEFGRGYLTDGAIRTRDAALEEARKNLEWDQDAAEMVAFITATPYPFDAIGAAPYPAKSGEWRRYNKPSDSLIFHQDP